MGNNIGLDQNGVDKVVDWLNGYLSDLHVLYVKLHNVHWNVEGTDFFALHARFEEYYDAVHEELDAVAEKIVILGSRPLARIADYIDRARLAESESKAIGPADAVRLVADDFSKMIVNLRNGIAVAQDAGDETTADLLIGSLGRYEKDLWMLKAFLT